MGTRIFIHRIKPADESDDLTYYDDTALNARSIVAG
jgi:hypothetical protein